MVEADFSLKEQYAYYGLREVPGYSELVRNFGKNLTKIEPPSDREAKYYALGPYRAYILEAQRKYHDIETSKFAYNQSESKAPEQATFHTLPSVAGYDPNWTQQAHQNDAAEANILATEALYQETLAQEAEAHSMRRQSLFSLGYANSMDPRIMMHSEDLQEAEVPHVMPAPRSPMLQMAYPARTVQWVAPGQQQPPEFPTFDELNGTNRSFRPGRLRRVLSDD